jgi:dolichol-phosphate mannosyltransferase
LRRTSGQSAAIYYGLRAATQPLVGLMDGDGQNDPVDFARLVGALRESGADVVCGYRAHRHDTWQRRVVSRLGNGIRRAFLHDEARDTGCSRRSSGASWSSSWCRFAACTVYLPAIFRHAGLRVAEVGVNHRARLGGISKYGNWHRALDGLFDLIGVSWLLDRKLLPPSMETK